MVVNGQKEEENKDRIVVLVEGLRQRVFKIYDSTSREP